MRRFISVSSILFLMFIGISSLPAQQNLTMPRQSPYAEVTQRVGLTDITITFHRPGVNDRVIWGELVPYDQVWRAGANENTTIRFTDPVTIDGREIRAGTYGVHMIPGREEWTVILSIVTTGWGSFSYNESEDVLRIKVKPETTEFTERLNYYFDNPANNSVDVVMAWEKLAVRVPVSVDVKSVVLQNMRDELRGLPQFFWQSWNQAANYCLQNDFNLDEATTWVDRSIGMNRNFTNLRTKAALLEKAGNKAESEKLIAEGMEIATESELNAYGYQLLFGGETDQAVEIFQMNVDRHPDSWNVYDSLGEAYAAKGQTDRAIELYTKAHGMVSDDNQKKRIEGVLAELRSK